MIKNVIGWLNRNLSSDPTSSNSRVLQTVIVVNIVPLMWLVVAHANWQVSDNARLVLLTLITAGAGSYVAAKVTQEKPQ